MRNARQDWPVTSNSHFLDHWRPGSFYFDLFPYHLGIFPFTHIFVLVEIVRVEFFDIQIFYIWDGICNPPGNVLVVPYDNTRSAGKAYPNHIDIASYQVAFVPDWWGGLAQVRIITENRHTGSSHCSINYPVIACAQHTKTAQLLQLLVLFKHTQVNALVFHSRWDDQWMVGIIAGFEFCGSFASQFRNKASSYHFGFPVSSQVPTHHFGPLNAVIDLPGFRFETQDGKFNW